MKLNLIVKTRSKSSYVKAITDSVYEVGVNALPIGGKANLAVIEVLAAHFHVHKNQITIIAGFTRTNKVVTIDLQGETS